MLKRPIRHKFHAKTCECDGIKFPSKKERAFYLKLKKMQEDGEVVGFLRQVPLHLSGGIRYVMDFLVFYSDGTCEGIEVKGFETSEWKMKKKMVEAEYGWMPLTIVK